MMTIFEEIEQIEQETAVFGLQWETKDQIMTRINHSDIRLCDRQCNLYVSSFS